MTTTWLNCQVHKGMFSDERAVAFVLSSGKAYSAFVPQQLVRGEINHAGQVLVSAFQDGDAWWAVVPNEYRDVVAVKSTELVSA